MCHSLNHSLEKSIDFVVTETTVTTVVKVVVLPPPASVGRVEFEVPQEVRRLFEAFADGENLVDQILHTDDV